MYGKASAYRSFHKSFFELYLVTFCLQQYKKPTILFIITDFYSLLRGLPFPLAVPFTKSV